MKKVFVFLIYYIHLPNQTIFVSPPTLQGFFLRFMEIITESRDHGLRIFVFQNCLKIFFFFKITNCVTVLKYFCFCLKSSVDLACLWKELPEILNQTLALTKNKKTKLAFKRVLRDVVIRYFPRFLMRFFEPVSVTIWGEFFREISIQTKNHQGKQVSRMTILIN